MAVTRTKTGRWRAKVSFREDGTVKTREKTFGLKREAQAWEVDFRRSLDLRQDESIRFGEMVQLYLDNKKNSVTPETVRDQELLLDKFASHLNKRRMIQIKQSDYYKIYDDIVASDYSWSRKNRSIMVVRAFSRYANTRHNFPDLARNLQSIKKQDGDEQVFDIWTPEEFDHFIERVDNGVLKIMFTTLFMTGMRRGEARAMLKADFDTKDKSLNINKAMRRNVANKLKTASSRREVKLDQTTFEMLLPLMKSEGKYLFGGLKPISNSMMQRAFTTAKEKAWSDGLHIPDIRIHDLRHSHASILINNGANIVAVSRRLGHGDIQTTLRRYTHLMQKSDDEVIDIINQL